MKVKVFFWFVEGNTEEADRLYADRPEEVEEYLKEIGIRIKARSVRLLDPYREESESFNLFYPFEYSLAVRGGFLEFTYGFKGMDFPKMKLYLPRTGGIQVYELVDPVLIGGFAW